ncbi:MAG: acyltransferase family protein [Phycisphaerales bacterium]|jgi:fucose 4-O-acetylase-like acetyltransferase|nr:acyltransferase family protein [Phycisphaerales bacterium]
MPETKQNTRYHGLDLLRAAMMLLGIVVHVSISYLARVDGGPPVPWPYADPDHTHAAAVLISFIHMFRMPAFFLIAGFFAGLLIDQRGRSAFFSNRFMRILVPLVIGWMILWPLTMVISLFGITVNDFPEGQRNVSSVLQGLGEQIAVSRALSSHIPEPQHSVLSLLDTARSIQAAPPRRLEHTDLLHLWFLQHLFLYCVLSLPIAWLLARRPGNMRTSLQAFMRRLVTGDLRWLRIPVLGTFTFVLLLQSRDGTGIDTRAGFIPDLTVFITYLFFFLIGWVLHAHRDLIGEIKSGAWIRTIAGTSLLLGSMLLSFTSIVLGIEIDMPALDPEARNAISSWSHIASQLLQAFGFWFFVLGIIGLAERAFEKANPVVRYLVDASYWIYLAHLPLAMLLPILMHDVRMPGILKLGISLVLVTIPLIVTYHFLVRATFIGRLLNGRRFDRRVPWKRS